MESDFRIIPPIKRYSKFYEEDIYVIPCKVIAIGNLIKGKTYEIKIEILDFTKAVLVETTGITYKGSLELLKNPPFVTECIIRRIGDCKFKLIVYNRTNPGLIERLFNVKEILNRDESEIMDIYNHHYKKLRDWLGPIESNSTENYHDDLPF